VNKQEYLVNLRETSAYPKYRLVVTILSTIGYIGCGGYAIVSLLALFKGGSTGVVIGLAGLIGAAAGAFLIIPFYRDIMHMGSDIADSLLDRNVKDGRGGGGAV
jgi:hypothetical protein